MIKLSEEETRRRFQKLYNYERILYPNAKKQKEKLKRKNKILEEENRKLREENKQIEKLQLQLEELRIMKFGKKRMNLKQEAKALPLKESKLNDKKMKRKKRSLESYRRTEPSQDKITDRLRLELEKCPECGEVLTEKKEHIHYREDLYEVEDLLKSAQKIVETIIESGKCNFCEERKYAMEIPKQKVIIGQNIRNMVVYLTVVQGQSYSEVKRSIKHQYGFDLSNGVIANILEGESRLVTSYYNYLVEELEKEPAHYDETSWKTKSKGKEINLTNYLFFL